MLDAHLHLQDPAYEPDLPDVLARAQAAGVRRLVCNGTRPQDWPRVLELAQSHPAIVPCFGLHPWFVSEAPEGWLQGLEEFLDNIPSGVGEAGLDHIRGEGEPQERAFRAQLSLARSKSRPLMVHCVQAFGPLMEILRKDGPLPAGFLLHAYGGPADMVQPLAELGAYFSFAGFNLDERRLRSRQALCSVPLDRLLLETDCPDPKERGEPADVRKVLALAARLRAEDEGRLAEAVWENGQRLLGALERA